MAPPPLATAAAAAAEEFLEVFCAGCEEKLEVERGLTEFVCPDCATAQSLPPELMPPPRRRALPLPRGAADARAARLPCGACGELLSVPVGLSRCACPLCGAELAVDSARLRNYILSSAEAAGVPLAAASVAPIVAARERWQERPSYAMCAGLPQAEPDVRLIPPRRTQARSAASKASRAKSTYINKTGSKSFARMHQEESRSGDPSLENSEGSGDDYAPAMGAKRRVSARRNTSGRSPKDLQERSDPQAARAKRKAGDEVSTLRKKVVVTEESRPKNSQESAVLEAARDKRRAEDEAAALRKKVIAMEESQRKLQEDLARVTNAMSAMQKMMATGGLPNRNG